MNRLIGWALLVLVTSVCSLFIYSRRASDAIPHGMTTALKRSDRLDGPHETNSDAVTTPSPAVDRTFSEVAERCGLNFYDAVFTGDCDLSEELAETINDWSVIPYLPQLADYCHDFSVQGGAIGTTCEYEPARAEGQYATLNNRQLSELAFESADPAALIVAGRRMTTTRELALATFLEAAGLAGNKAGDPLLIAGQMYTSHLIGRDSRPHPDMAGIATRLALEEMAAETGHPAALPAAWEATLRQAVSTERELAHYQHEIHRLKKQFQTFIAETQWRAGVGERLPADGHELR